MFRVIVSNEKLLCDVLSHFATKLKIDKPETRARMQTFICSSCNEYHAAAVPVKESKIWSHFMKEILKEVGDERSSNVIASGVIGTALKYFWMPPSPIITYLLEQAKISDQTICVQSLFALIVVLRRIERPEKKVLRLTTPLRKLSDFPKLFDKANPSNNAFPFASFDEMEADFAKRVEGYSIPEDTSFWDETSQGYHRIADILEVSEYEDGDPDLFLPHLEEILSNRMSAGNASSMVERSTTSFFWEYITGWLGGRSFRVLRPAWHKAFTEPQTLGVCNAICEYGLGLLAALRSLSTEDAAYALQHFLLPLVAVSSQVPHFSEGVEILFMTASVWNDPIRFKPLLQFLVEATDANPEAGLGKRGLIGIMNILLFWRCRDVYSSIDVLWERYVQPCFLNLPDYGFHMIQLVVGLYVIILESTCFTRDSTFWVPEVEEKRNALIGGLDALFERCPAEDRTFHNFLVVLLSSVTAAAAQVISAIAPVLIRRMSAILNALGSADVITGEMLEPSFRELFESHFWVERPSLCIEVIQAILEACEHLANPVKMKGLAALERLVCLTLHAYSRSDIQKAVPLFRQWICVKNHDVKVAVMKVFGLIYRYSEIGDEMNENEAAAIISTAVVFDEVDPLVMKAFEIVRNKIEDGGVNSTRFLQEIVDSFWYNHANSMIPSVEKMLSPFRMLTRPGYMS
jgi:hypothetical protein